MSALATRREAYLEKVNRLFRFISRNTLLLSIVVAMAVVVLAIELGVQNNKNVPVNTWYPSHYVAEPDNRLSYLANWDGKEYISIAQHGYSEPSLTNYFPLYPITIHIVNKVISSSLTSGLIVSWSSLVGAVYFYIKIIKKYFHVSKNIEALKAVALFLLYPTGIFLVANYTESLFAFLALAAIYFGLEKRHLLAGVFVMFATATHVNGLFLLVLVALLLYEEKVRVFNILKTVVISLLGVFSYMLFLQVKYKDAFEFIKQQSVLHQWLKHSFFWLLGTVSPLQFIFVAIILLSAIYWWPRRKSFSIYSLLYIFIPLVGGSFGGFTRYSLMVFPMQFMIFEKLRSKDLAYSLVLALFTIGWAYYVVQFSGGYVS